MSLSEPTLCCNLSTLLTQFQDGRYVHCSGPSNRLVCPRVDLHYNCIWIFLDLESFQQANEIVMVCTPLFTTMHHVERERESHVSLQAYRLLPTHVFMDVSIYLANIKECYTDIRLMLQSNQKFNLASASIHDEVCLASIKVLSSQSSKKKR